MQHGASPPGLVRRSLSTGQAAARASCHPVTILRAIEKGELPAVRLGQHGNYRIRPEALEGQLLAGFDADAFRTALARACRASATPSFSPHDLRHRRASLWHLAGVPVAEAAGRLGHSAQEHLKTYTHVVLDRSEVDYRTLIGARTVLPPVLSPTVEIGQ